MTAAEFPALLQAFFTDRLLRERAASPHTVAAYRSTFRLLLRFAASRLSCPLRPCARRPRRRLPRRAPRPPQAERGDSARSRNPRLAALHAFFRYVALNEPCPCAAAVSARSPSRPSASSAAL